MISISSNSTAATTPARKHDGEIITARNQAAWLSFEAGIHQNDTLRARVSRALDRFGLGSSTAAVDEAIDYLINKELGQSARYFNQTGKPQFNQQQITHAVLSFMAGKEQQRHMTDLPIVTDDADEDDGPCGTHRACHLADPGHIRPDEYAARRDALRAIAAMIPDTERELYSLMLAVREPGMLDRIHAYADRHQIGRSTVYFRIKKLAEAIQNHPWFDEITAPFRTASRTA
jgi:hypothetical protein